MTLEVVAIDGPAGSGKSSVARALATALAWSYLDTGAMYRAVTVVALREGADLHDPDRLGALAETLVIETLPFVSANGVNVEGDLRTSDVNRAVSLIAAVPRVRAAMVLQQRSFAARQKLGTVVEGRDITTVVFPRRSSQSFFDGLPRRPYAPPRRRGRGVVAPPRQFGHGAGRFAAAPGARCDDRRYHQPNGRRGRKGDIRVPESTKMKLNTARTVSYRCFRSVIFFLWTIMFRPRVSGRENIPNTGAVLIAPVHRSNLDFAFTMFMTKRKTFFMAKDSLWTVPVLAPFISMMGAFPVKRGTADRESLNFAQRVLEIGEALVLFPEGTRQEGLTVGHLHDGAMFIASRTGAVVVPVGIGHTERAMPKGSKFPRPVRVNIVIGEPLAPPEQRESSNEIADCRRDGTTARGARRRLRTSHADLNYRSRHHVPKTTRE
jgi:1-acyl-sn-glycerol-3-phosphate acyltransferase